jgi:hypothetical protein
MANDGMSVPALYVCWTSFEQLYPYLLRPGIERVNGGAGLGELCSANAQPPE